MFNKSQVSAEKRLLLDLLKWLLRANSSHSPLE